MPDPQLVATSWTSAGNTSPMRKPGTSPVPIAERLAAIADSGFMGFDLIGLIAVLRELGFNGPWGVEILSGSFRALPVGQALKLASGSALTVL